MFDIAGPGLAPALSVPFGLIEDACRRLSGLVKEMSQEELEYTGPSGDLNSTATLIAHVALTDLEYLHQIKGEPVPRELGAAYGPYHDENGRLPTVTGKTAAELLESYQRVVEMTRAYLETQSDADAAREVAIPWWSQPATVRFVLWHMAGHCMFHQGQIVRLRAWYKGQG